MPPDHLRNSARLDQSLVSEILTEVLSKAPRLTNHQYCLVGTAAAVLQGVAVEAGDIDLLMKDRDGVHAFSEALSAYNCLTAPGVLGFQYYAAFEIRGIKVEASTVEVPEEADCVEVSGEGPWKYRVYIDCGGFPVPTVSMELRLATEVLRDRPDRYTPITRWMQSNGCDLDLLQRAMEARGLHPETKCRIDSLVTQRDP